MIRSLVRAQQSISFRTLPNYYTNALDAAQIIVEMWKAIGVNAQVQVVENSSAQSAAGRQVSNDSISQESPTLSFSSTPKPRLLKLSATTPRKPKMDSGFNGVYSLTTLCVALLL